MKRFAVFVIYLVSASMTESNQSKKTKGLQQTVDYCNVKTCASPYIFRGGKEDHTRCINKGFVVNIQFSLFVIDS